MRMFGATPGSWLVRGYVDAVERFREQAAIGADSPREVYPPLFEALSWAHSLWDTWFRLVEPVGFVNSAVADLQGNRAGAREARLADRVAAVTLATASPPFSLWSRAEDATRRTASLSKT